MMRLLNRLFLLAALLLSPGVSGIASKKKEDENESALQHVNANLHSIFNKKARLAGLVSAGVIGFATDPLVEGIFNVTHVENEGEAAFRTTFLYGAARSITHGARAYGLVLLADLVQETFLKTKRYLCTTGEAATQVGFAVWAGLTVSTVKRCIFRQAVSPGFGLGRVGLFDRVIDMLIVAATSANVLNSLSVDIGMRLKSVFAASGISALVFTFASKGLVEQVVAGFIVQAWDAIEEGESVRLGDGTEGTVTRIGLTETVIVGSDNLATRIPNSQLTKMRVSNISRQKRSQVKQVLRFKYSDLDKIPGLLEDIKTEIKSNCGPKLITDGSKPFRAILSQYEADHVQVVVSCHFDMNPGAGEFVEMKQKVLFSIANAIKKNNVEFALPAIFYETSQSVPLLAPG